MLGYRWAGRSVEHAQAGHGPQRSNAELAKALAFDPIEVLECQQRSVALQVDTRHSSGLRRRQRVSDVLGGLVEVDVRAAPHIAVCRPCGSTRR